MQTVLLPLSCQHRAVILRADQSLCRHGARTPLSDLYWDGARFETGRDCGQLAQQAHIALHDASGGLAAPSKHNQQQVIQHGAWQMICEPHSALCLRGLSLTVTVTDSAEGC